MPDPIYPPLPNDLEGAQTQANQALQAAIVAGYQRLQVEILAPDLKPEELALPFLQATDPPLALVFSDAGAAALSQRDWQGRIPEGVSLQGLSGRTVISPETAVVFVMPSIVTVEAVEQLCGTLTQRPVILLNPQLQDASTVGVGLSGRRIRERFLTTFEPCYFLQSLAGGALTRYYPHPWILWQQTEDGEYGVLETLDRKPTGEEMAEIFAQKTGKSDPFWTGLQRFFQTLRR